MKREFTLDIDGHEVTVAAERDGDAIKVSRDDRNTERIAATHRQRWGSRGGAEPRAYPNRRCAAGSSAG
jgi:hypothetical protein